jgi:hypothetical protein
MAHFAKLDENNFVVQVCVVNNEVLDVQNEEQSGIDFLTDWSNGYTNWKQTSYNGNFRYNYAAIGYKYDETADAFIAPKPCKHTELLLNNQYNWECQNSDHLRVLPE